MRLRSTTVGPAEDNVYLIGFEEIGTEVWATQAFYYDLLGAWLRSGGQAPIGPTVQQTYAVFTQVQGTPAEVVPIPRTGQTQSYYAGDDGDLQKGAPWPVPRFTDNGDGTVTDNLTGLIWMRFAGGFSGTWSWVLDTTSEVEGGSAQWPDLTDGSMAGDWRLPNRRELESLIDISRRNPAVPAGHPFEEIRFQLYWTSSSYPGFEGQGAWAVDLATGEAVVQEKDMLFWGWPVRDGN